MVSRKTNSKSRSKILRKYEMAYETCIKKAMKSHPIISKKRPSSLKTGCVKKLSKKASKVKDKTENVEATKESAMPTFEEYIAKKIEKSWSIKD